MNTLLINAHPCPNDTSYSQKLQDCFIKEFQKQNSSAKLTVLSLYDSFIPTLDKKMMTIFEKEANNIELNASEKEISLRMKELLKEFKEHKRVVIVLPIHNFNVSSKLKDYMDNILIARETFKYTSDGSVGLMNDNRKVLLLQSSGAIYTNNDRYTPLEFSHYYIKEMFCNIMGFNEFDIIRVQGTAVSATNKDEIVQNAFKEISSKMKDFLS